MGQRPEFLERGQPVRLQAFLARSGVASRRAAEEMIAHGRVSVNGARVTVMGLTVRPGVDRVAVDGEEVKVAPTTWLALHKPRGYVTSRDDPFGRRTVYELLPEQFHGLFHVGRLDRDSEGLLLLTNDGERANRLLHPSFGVTKEYEVVATGKPTDATLRALVEGVELDDGPARAVSAKLLGPAGNGLSRLVLVLREGRKREVRRMLEAVGHPVRRLLRKRFGPVTLGELPRGKYRVVAPEELARTEETARAERERSARAEGTRTAAGRKDRLRAEEPRTEGARKGRPRAEGTRAEGARKGRSRAEGTRTEGARKDRPRAEEPRTEGTRKGRSRAEGTRTEGARKGRPRAEEPRTEGARKGRPRAEGTQTEGARKGRPRAEGTGAEGARKDRPRAEGPRKDGPARGRSRADGPGRTGRPEEDAAGPKHRGGGGRSERERSGDPRAKRSARPGAGSRRGPGTEESPPPADGSGPRRPPGRGKPSGPRGGRKGR